MAQTKIAAVMRAGVYSPNHIGNDATIMNTVAEQLRKRGCEVRIYTEEQFAAGNATEDVVINMCRERRSTELLQQMEDSGCLVINSGYGIENCIRERQARILLGSGIPYPQSIIVDTDEAVARRLEKMDMRQCWIKRGDFHAQHAEDVCYVRTPAEAQDVLQEYFLRGFRRAVISRHLPGRLVKFYGVAGTNFFHWFRPFEEEPRGLKSVLAAGSDADTRQAEKAVDANLRTLCSRAANELNLVVYGGECIEASDGTLTIIDFNDWPSFSACRQDAATNIAKAVIAAARQKR